MWASAADGCFAAQASLHPMFSLDPKSRDAMLLDSALGAATDQAQ
ncbi:hypothetical protein [Trinickia sp.]